MMPTLSGYTGGSNRISRDILLLVLWMGGDAAIFNSEDLSNYLPYNKEEINSALKKLESAKILSNITENYALTKSGASLVDYALINLISKWAFISQWKQSPKYKTIHQGFILYSRNKAISNIFRSSRSFVTDYFQIVLENFVRKYEMMEISYFKNFRKILIRICINPTISFVVSNENIKEIYNSFLKDEIVTAIPYENNNIIVINNEYLKKRKEQ